MHSIHPDTHTHGLADDCPRCAEHAEHPVLSLDDMNLRRLMEDEVFSHTDAVAAAVLRTDMEHAGHLARVAPDLFFAFLDRYDIRVDRYSHSVYEMENGRVGRRKETVER